MDDREKRLITSLILMVQQYLDEDDAGHVDTLCMRAGESAVQSLAEYGLMVVTHEGRCGRWTDAGNAFRNARPPV